MWSGVMFSTTATSAWNVSMSSSWKLDSSATTHASGSIRPGSSVRARPTLPATSTDSPPARSIAPISSVVVVLPLVPVTPTNGFGQHPVRQLDLAPHGHARGPRGPHHRRLTGHTGALDQRC